MEEMKLENYNPQWFAVILEEYKSLRTESLTSMANQQSTLRYAVAAIGVSLTLAFNITDPTMRFFTFSLFVPVLSLVFYAFYANEFARMVRVGRYIEAVENKVNEAFPGMPAPLGWEHWLEKKRKGRTPRLPFYIVAPVVFASASLFPGFMALYFKKDGPFTVTWNCVSIAVSMVFIVALVMVISVKLKKIRRDYNDYF
jgi:hypothetical protein